MINAQLNLDVAQVRLQALRHEARSARLVRSLPTVRSPRGLAILLPSFRHWNPAVQVPEATPR